MGFGTSGSSPLVTLGRAPAIASASVDAAEVVTGFASGTSRLRLGNVDKRTFLPLVVLCGGTNEEVILMYYK